MKKVTHVDLNALSISLKSEKKMEIILWGCNDFSESLYQLLSQTDIKVIAFIDPTAQTTQFCGKPLYSPNDFKTHRDLANTPIVVAAPHDMTNNMPHINFETIRQFKLRIQEIANEFAIANPLLHPAALVDFLQIDFSNKIITFGLAGSGNTVFNHLLQKIQPLLPSIPFASRFFEQLCYEYTQIIHQIATDIIFSIGGNTIHVGPWKVGTSHFNYLFNHETNSVYSFQTRDHIICSNYGYHVLPTAASVKQLQSRKFKLFFILRCPLDTLLSLVKKNEGIDAETKTIKNNDALLHSAFYVLKVLSTWRDTNIALPQLRYEQLLNDPINYICDIMRTLDIEPDKAFAHSVWQEIGLKELPNVPKNHFWQGGARKWEKYLTQEHLAFLKAQGIEKVLEDYNYPDSLKTFKNLTAKHSTEDFAQYKADRFKETAKMLKVSDHNFDTANTKEFLEFLFDEPNLCSLEHVLMGSKNRAHLNSMKQAFDNKFVKLITQAGSHPECRVN